MDVSVSNNNNNNNANRVNRDEDVFNPDVVDLFTDEVLDNEEFADGDVAVDQGIIDLTLPPTIVPTDEQIVLKIPDNIKLKKSGEKRTLTFRNVGQEWSWQRIALQVFTVTGKSVNVTKGANGVYHVHFQSAEEANKAVRVTFPFGKLVTTKGGVDKTYYYRITFTVAVVKPDSEARIIQAILDATGSEAVSVTPNPEKKCTTVYLPTVLEFARLYAHKNNSIIVVPAAGPFTSAFEIRAVLSTATTNDPDIVKVQVLDVPEVFDDATLLEVIRGTVESLIPPHRILGASVFRYGDSNKNANFGFAHVAGKDYAKLLYKITFPALDSQISFRKAEESDKKRKRDVE